MTKVVMAALMRMFAVIRECPYCGWKGRFPDSDECPSCGETS